jgi:putative nucleotidyltransferase with HDIG domain
MSVVGEKTGKETAQKLPWALRQLPSFPAVATKVLQLLAKEDVPIRRIVDLIRTDPAFSAGILRVANSALFGFVSQVETVKHAVVIVGLDRVRTLTLTVAMGSYLKAALRIVTLRGCWRHSLACALLSEELATSCSVHLDRAYTAGLLHDIGRLGLLVAYPAEYSNVLAVTEENSMDILQVERDLFDLDHCQAGLWLMKEWKFPEEFHDIAARHHSEPTTGEFDLLALVRLACRLADTLGFQAVKPARLWTFQEIQAALPEPFQQRFNPDPDSLRTRVATVIDSLD